MKVENGYKMKDMKISNERKLICCLFKRMEISAIISTFESRSDIMKWIDEKRKIKESKDAKVES